MTYQKVWKGNGKTAHLACTTETFTKITQRRMFSIVLLKREKLRKFHVEIRTLQFLSSRAIPAQHDLPYWQQTWRNVPYVKRKRQIQKTNEDKRSWPLAKLCKLEELFSRQWKFEVTPCLYSWHASLDVCLWSHQLLKIPISLLVWHDVTQRCTPFCPWSIQSWRLCGSTLKQCIQSSSCWSNHWADYQ